MMEMAQVGVRTRAQAAALALAATATTTAATASSAGGAKKRKVNNNEGLKFSIELRSSRRRRHVVITPDNSSVIRSPLGNNSDHRTMIEDRCSSPSSDHASASCCSSNCNNGSSERIIKFADLEGGSVEVETPMYYTCRERRETTPSSEFREESSEELDSTAIPSSKANSRRRSMAPEKMPTEAEIEEFFAEAEKNLQKQFGEKYNYDIVKDEPLEGRYEWIRLKP